MNGETDLVVDDVLAAMQAQSLYGLDFGSESDLSDDGLDQQEHAVDEDYMEDEGLDDIGVHELAYSSPDRSSPHTIDLELQPPITRRGSADSLNSVEPVPVGNDATAQEVREARAGTVEEALKFAGGFGPWHWQHFLMTSAIWFCVQLAMSAHPAADMPSATTLRLFEASGAVLGSAVLGIASDVLGRMRCCYWSLIITVVAGIVGVLAPLASASSWLVLLVRFVIPLGGVAACSCFFVLLMEYMPFTHRLGVACVVIGSGSVAQSTGHTASLFVEQDWLIRFLGICPLALLLAVILVGHDRARRLQRRDLAPIAESARWLLAEDKDEAAVRWMAAVAMRNRARLDPSIIFMPEELRSDADADLIRERKTLLALAPPETRLDMLVSPVLWRPTCALMMVCAAITTSQCVARHISANNFSEQSRIVEMVSVPISQLAAVYLTNFLVVRHGRRKTMTGFVSFTAFFSVMVASTLEQQQFVLLFNLGMSRFSAMGAVIVMHVLLMECIPTVARGTGFGVVISLGWAACMVAEGVAAYSLIASLMLSAAFSCAAAPMCLFWIPETKRLPLPDVLPDTSLEADTVEQLYAETAQDDDEQDGVPLKSITNHTISAL